MEKWGSGPPTNFSVLLFGVLGSDINRLSIPIAYPHLLVVDVCTMLHYVLD